MRPFLTLLISIQLCTLLHAQSTIDTVLARVLKNNKSIQSDNSYWESQKLLYKTGNTPEDPTIEYDRLTGIPSNAGTQVEFTVSQTFYFPSVYAKRKQVKDRKISQIEYRKKSTQQDILLEAKTICIELVFRNKTRTELIKIKKSTEMQLEHFKKRLVLGEGNALEVNKAALQLLEVNRQNEENNLSISNLLDHLTELNGGIALTFMDTVYAPMPVLGSFEQVEKEYEANDPIKSIFENARLISQKQVELSKAFWLPKMEAGYHYQGILGQKFSGFHAGISIPLWENKNTVKQKKQEQVLSELQLQEHLTEHYFEIKHLFTKYENLQDVLKQYRDALGTYMNTALLDKAFASGQLSSIEYFMEVNFYRNAYLNYLQTEMQLNLVVAELTKYKL